MLKQLIVYGNDTVYGCTTCVEEVPVMFAYNGIYLTPEKVAKILETPCILKKEFPQMLKGVREKYRNGVVRILDFQLPDINGSECNIDD